MAIFGSARGLEGGWTRSRREARQFCLRGVDGILCDCVHELVEGVHVVICVGGEEMPGQSVRKRGSASQLVRTCYNEMTRARAGVMVNGALDFPRAALLCKTPNLV